MSERRDDLVADYVLGLMEPEVAERFELRMDRDADLAREVRDGRQLLHPLDLTARPLEAGDALWRRIEAEIAAPAAGSLPAAGAVPAVEADVAARSLPAESGRPAIGAASPAAGMAEPSSQSVSAARPGQTPDPMQGAKPVPGTRRGTAWASLWQNVGFWRPVGLAGIAASLALALGLAAALVTARATPQFVAILVSEDGAAAGAIVEVDAAGEARLIPLRDIPVPEGRALQVWTLPSPERGPVSVGLIDRARSTDLALGALPPTHGDQLFEITLEPEAGSPVGRPTGPVLFKGLTARAL